MDKERIREHKRTAAMTSRLSVTRTREQQKALSSVHLSHNNANHHHLSFPCCARSGECDMDLVDGWSKNKVKDSGGSSSYENCEVGIGGLQGGDDEVVRPAAAAVTTNINSKKRDKLSTKALDEYVAVDPALVPRKLRSAIHKRSSDSVSLVVPSAKKKIHHACIGINGVKRPNRSMQSDLLTKDEEEVIETLSALANIATDTKPINNGTVRMLLLENGDKKTTTSTILEGDDAFEQPKIITMSSIRNIDLESNVNTESKVRELSVLPKNDHPLQLSSGMTMSYPGTLPHTLPSNGQFHLTRLEIPALPPMPEIQLSTHASAPTTQEVKSLNEKNQTTQHISCQQEETSNTLNMVPTTTAHGNLTPPFATKIVTQLGPTCPARPGRTRNDSSSGKSMLGSYHKRGSWKTCATHVFISHLIRNYQNAEKQQQGPLPLNERKFKDGSELGEVADIEGRKSVLSVPSSTGTSGCTTDGQNHEMRTGMQHDKSLQPSQKKPTTETYSHLKQARDFLPSSSCRESANSGKKAESSDKLPVPCLQSPPPHPHMMPFSLTPGHYPSPYPDQLAAQQLPHYIGHPFYGLHIGHVVGGSTTHQQRQIWQAHLTNYRMPSANPKWQNIRPHDPSLIAFPITYSSPTDNQHATHHSSSTLQQQILSVPFPANTNVKKHHQQTYQSHTGRYSEGSTLRPDGSAQLQLLCNTQNR